MLSRDQFGFLLRQECKLAERHSNYFGIIHIRVDGFPLESLNLQTFTNLLRRMTRDTDVFGELKEKGLGVIFHNTDLEGLQTVVGRIEPEVKRYFSKILGSEKVMIGRACFPTHATTARDIILAVTKQEK